MQIVQSFTVLTDKSTEQVLKQQNNFQNSQVLKEMGQENSVQL